MMTEPKIIERPEQPYVAIATKVPMSGIDVAARRLFDDIWTWVSKKGVETGRGAILKYNVIDMERELELEFGAPTVERIPGEGNVISGILPAGRYASILYRGPYGGPEDGLYKANARLIGWGMENGIRWDSRQTPAGEQFACRMEIYLTDPQSEPDPAKWETEVAIKLAD
jgi:effector-binding domain-containing protein